MGNKATTTVSLMSAFLLSACVSTGEVQDNSPDNTHADNTVTTSQTENNESKPGTNLLFDDDYTPTPPFNTPKQYEND